MHSVGEFCDALPDNRLCSRRLGVGQEAQTAQAVREVAELLSDTATSGVRRDPEVPDSGRCSVVTVAHRVGELLRRLRDSHCAGADPDVLAVVVLVNDPVSPLKARALCGECGTVYPKGVGALRAEFTDTAYVSYELPSRHRGACHLDRGGRLECTEERVVGGSGLGARTMLTPSRHDGLQRFSKTMRQHRPSWAKSPGATVPTIPFSSVPSWIWYVSTARG